MKLRWCSIREELLNLSYSLMYGVCVCVGGVQIKAKGINVINVEGEWGERAGGGER